MNELFQFNFNIHKKHINWKIQSLVLFCSIDPSIAMQS